MGKYDGDINLMTGYKVWNNLTPDTKTSFELDGKTWNTLSAYIYSKKVPENIENDVLPISKRGFKAICNENTLTNVKWHDIKVRVVAEGLLASFTQNKDLMCSLLNTGDRLIRCAGDYTGDFWGVGKSGKGNNIYGKLLMEMREMFRARCKAGIPEDLMYTQEDIDSLVTFTNETKIKKRKLIDIIGDTCTSSVKRNEEPPDVSDPRVLAASLAKSNENVFYGSFGKSGGFRAYYIHGKVLVFLKLEEAPNDRVMIGVFDMTVLRKQPELLTQDWMIATAPHYRIVQGDPSTNSALLWELLNYKGDREEFNHAVYQNKIDVEHRLIASGVNEFVFDGRFGRIGKMRIYHYKLKDKKDELIISCQAENAFGKKIYVVGSFPIEVIENQPHELTLKWMTDNATRFVYSSSDDLDKNYSLVIHLLGL